MVEPGLLHIDFTPEEEALIERVAASRGLTAEELAREAIVQYLDRRDALVSAEIKSESARIRQQGWTAADDEWESISAADDDEEPHAAAAE